MFSRLFIIACFPTLVLLAGCSKGGVVQDPGPGPHVITYNDTVAPVLEVHTPAVNQVYTSGANILVTGKITDESGLYRGSVRITNDANGELIKQQLYEIHGILLYQFSVSHTASVSSATDYTVTVSFEDHGLNTVSSSVKIKVNP